MFTITNKIPPHRCNAARTDASPFGCTLHTVITQKAKLDGAPALRVVGDASWVRHNFARLVWCLFSGTCFKRLANLMSPLPVRPSSNFPFTDHSIEACLFAGK